jgi:putative transposase
MKNRKRNRKLGYDYSQNNLYFVTICVQDRKCCFGDVRDVGTGRDLSVHDSPSIHDSISIHNSPSIHDSQKEMILNEFGKIVERQWLWLEEQYPYIKLHSFVVMPNHFHGILEIDSGVSKDSSRTVPTEKIKIKSLSQLVGAFKTTSSKWIHLAGLEGFSWQRSFHDHIIRNDFSYEKIANYIITNPERWNIDTFFEEVQNNSNWVGCGSLGTSALPQKLII